MPSYYTYLIASLPMLLFEMKPPFSFAQLLQICQRCIPESDIQTLKITSQPSADIYEGTQPTLKRWFDFDTALRNELVKIRATRKHLDPLKYVRGKPQYVESSLTRLALSAYRNPSLLEAERMLDHERWHLLDELAFGHYFDLDCLIVYAFKLLILERWERIRTQDKSKSLEELLRKE